MAENQGGASGKRGWPDARALGWPPEGVEAKPAPADAVPPFELAPDPGGSGALVAVAVDQPPPAVEPPAESAAGPDAVLQELRALRQTVAALSAEVKALRDSGARPAGANGLVPARGVSDQQAGREIQEYFLRHPGETLYPAQIADALGLPVVKVAELCEALARRGQLGRASAV